MRVARPGSATVETAEGTFVVARGGLRGGMDGDLVRVTLAHVQRQADPRAFVQSVLQRATTTFLGTYGEAGPLGAVVPLDVRLRRDFFVLPNDPSPARLHVAEGDVVSARIVEYPSRQEAGVVTLERRVGSATELDLAVEGVIASHGLATTFPERVEEAARGLEVADVAAELACDPVREDLRGVACVTVDPASAKDFDDAVSCRCLPDGGYEVGVHIADVTHYVRWGDSLDVEARSRTCSVYLVDRVLPMLPACLSDDACSLRPGEERLAMSVTLALDRRGRVKGARACPSAIRSRARLDYDTVDDVLAGRRGAEALQVAEGTPEEAAETLRLLDEVARLRGRIRHDRGAIDFPSEEAKVTLDADGHPTGVEVRRKTPATSLVEEAMLMANEAVARMLAERDLPAAFRVHETPSPESLGETLPALHELGALAPGDAERVMAGDPHAIQAVLERVAGTPGEYLASTLLLRAQRRAVYLPHNDGHYALGARAYCHFTSPIRRYPDDLVHRALKALLYASASGEVRRHAGVPGTRELLDVTRLLPQLCRTCSERERVADAAARDSQKLKMAELMAGHVGEAFSGVVVGIERYGLFVRLDETCAEGLLPVRELGEECFSFDESRMSLTGEASGRRWRLGQRIAVTVTGCDPSKGHIDLALAGDAAKGDGRGIGRASKSLVGRGFRHGADDGPAHPGRAAGAS